MHRPKIDRNRFVGDFCLKLLLFELENKLIINFVLSLT